MNWKLNITNMSFLSKPIHRFCIIPVKAPNRTLPKVKMAGEREATTTPCLAWQADPGWSHGFSPLGQLWHHHGEKGKNLVSEAGPATDTPLLTTGLSNRRADNVTLLPGICCWQWLSKNNEERRRERRGSRLVLLKSICQEGRRPSQWKGPDSSAP